MNDEMELRKWCAEKAMQWVRHDETVTTIDMLDHAALIERYVTTGKHSPMIEEALIKSAMEEAERVTPSVSQSKAKAVCDTLADFCGIIRKP